LRELLGGKVDLVPGEDESLWAEYSLNKAGLLSRITVEVAGIDGLA
jgi:hypothetical protein